MKHRISRRAFLHGCTLLAASAAVGSLTSCGRTDAKNSGLPQIIVGSDTYPPYIYLNNDGVPAGIDVEIATEAFRRMGYTARFESIEWEQKQIWWKAVPSTASGAAFPWMDARKPTAGRGLTW